MRGIQLETEDTMGGSGGSSDFDSIGGSGGSQKGGGGKGKASAAFDCRSFRATVSLRSPDPKVLANVRVGQSLRVVLGGGGRAVVAKANGRTAGSIVLPELDSLVACLTKGIEYSAKVLSVEGGACVVEVFSPTR
jgi:hypothetical protein